jgi:prolyl-tRNA editing enzyme YbaK/EbsC (Cys-tRNA(Pro) deacylase)
VTELSLQERLNSLPAWENPDLLATPVAAAVRLLATDLGVAVTVAEIDPALADTAAFCAHYGVLPDESANCVIVAGRRGEVTMMAACVVLATTRADVNGVLRRTLGAKKVSFAAMDVAVSESAMEYGGITPIGLPADWPIFIDRGVVDAGDVVVGSGLRRSKIVVAGSTLAALPNATVLEGLGLPAAH